MHGRETLPEIDPPLEILDAFIATLHAVRCDFSLAPKKEHIATCINYADLLEMRTEFVRELTNTVTAFVYSSEKQRQVVDAFKLEGRAESAAWAQLLKKAHQKFRRSSLQGQFCELLLSNLLQYYFKAAPLLRKMALTTNPENERNGVDAIHVARVGGQYVLYIGEAKSYDRQRGALKAGLVDAIRDVHRHYRDHRSELNLYTFEDFLAPELEQLARGYLAGTAQLEVQLVCIVAYDDKGMESGANRDELLKSAIDRALQEASNMSEHPVFKEIPANLMPRFNYIIFPIREMDRVIKAFAERIDHG
jgi:hypothetical protein